MPIAYRSRATTKLSALSWVMSLDVVAVCSTLRGLPRLRGAGKAAVPTVGADAEGCSWDGAIFCVTARGKGSRSCRKDGFKARDNSGAGLRYVGRMSI